MIITITMVIKIGMMGPRVNILKIQVFLLFLSATRLIKAQNELMMEVSRISIAKSIGKYVKSFEKGYLKIPSTTIPNSRSLSCSCGLSKIVPINKIKITPKKTNAAQIDHSPACVFAASRICSSSSSSMESSALSGPIVLICN